MTSVPAGSALAGPAAGGGGGAALLVGPAVDEAADVVGDWDRLSLMVEITDQPTATTMMTVAQISAPRTGSLEKAAARTLRCRDPLLSDTRSDATLRGPLLSDTPRVGVGA
jgi:hypothetical protein